MANSTWLLSHANGLAVISTNRALYLMITFFRVRTRTQGREKYNSKRKRAPSQSDGETFDLENVSSDDEEQANRGRTKSRKKARRSTRSDSKASDASQA